MKRNINPIDQIKSKFIPYDFNTMLGILFIILPLVNLFAGFMPVSYSNYFFLIPFVCFTLKPDKRTVISMKSFLQVAVPFLAVILLIFVSGNGLWHGVLRLEMGRNLFDLNDEFKNIPFNDGAFTRLIQPVWFTEYMKVVYNTGFVLAVILPIVRSAMALDIKKMVRYTLSAHVLQVFLITPLYFTFFLQEVWYVNGHPDMLGRVLTPAQTLETVLNCFPSMHTSIAFAMFLLVLREKNKVFKWIWGIYCISVIYSTMYLEIHWVLDVIAGLVFGWLVVKLADFVIQKVQALFPEKFITGFYKKQDSNLIGCGE